MNQFLVNHSIRNVLLLLSRHVIIVLQLHHNGELAATVDHCKVFS